MSCKDCNKDLADCGCGPKGVHVSPPSNCNPPDCPNPELCPEITPSTCVAYQGDPVLCGLNTIYTTGDTLDEVLESITNYACSSSGTVMSVTGNVVDNTDPLNPVVTAVESVTGNVVDNTDPQNPIVTAVESVTGNVVDNTDPQNPIVYFTLPVNNTVFVDPIFGNDSTGAYEDMTLPFQTLAAARVMIEGLLLPGEVGLIHGRAGEYVSELIYGSVANQVNYYFEDGAIATNCRFLDSLGATTMNVTGHLVFTGAVAGVFHFNFSYRDSYVRMHFKDTTINTNRGIYCEALLPDNLGTINLHITTDTFSGNADSATTNHQIITPRSNCNFSFICRKASGRLNGNIFRSREILNAKATYKIYIDVKELDLKPFPATVGAFTNTIYFIENANPDSVFDINIGRTDMDTELSTASSKAISISGECGKVTYNGDIYVKGTNAGGLLSQVVSLAETGESLVVHNGTFIIDPATVVAGVVVKANVVTSEVILNGKYKYEAGIYGIEIGTGANVCLDKAVFDTTCVFASTAINTGGTLKMYNTLLKDSIAAVSIIDLGVPLAVYSTNTISNIAPQGTVVFTSPVAEFTVDAALLIPKIL